MKAPHRLFLDEKDRSAIALAFLRYPTTQTATQAYESHPLKPGDWLAAVISMRVTVSKAIAHEDSLFVAQINRPQEGS
jgi:hypothetical protein